MGSRNAEVGKWAKNRVVGSGKYLKWEVGIYKKAHGAERLKVSKLGGEEAGKQRRIEDWERRAGGIV